MRSDGRRPARVDTTAAAEDVAVAALVANVPAVVADLEDVEPCAAVWQGDEGDGGGDCLRRKKKKVRLRPASPQDRGADAVAVWAASAHRKQDNSSDAHDAHGVAAVVSVAHVG